MIKHGKLDRASQPYLQPFIATCLPTNLFFFVCTPSELLGAAQRRQQRKKEGGSDFLRLGKTDRFTGPAARL